MGSGWSFVDQVSVGSRAVQTRGVVRGRRDARHPGAIVPPVRGAAAILPAGPAVTAGPQPESRVDRIAERDPQSAVLLRRLLPLAVRILAQTQVAGEFVFRLTAARGPDGSPRLRPEGMSSRYGVIAALGLMRLPESESRGILGGDNCQDLLGRLAKRLDDLTGRGDVALICWAAAESEHSELPHALDRLRELDRRGDPLDVVSAAWVLTALVAARAMADVEQHLALSRDRLLAARRAVFPHVIGGTQSWYRSHVGSFADQVYPVQALARLHRSADDPAALATADSVAAAICRAQGEAGQWWWHYDSRTGGVVEGYPVYSVHQHAMAPMALLDLAEAGGQDHVGAICRGLRWLARRPETGAEMVSDYPPVIWRKVARSDPGKAVRGVRAAATRLRQGTRLPGIDLVFRPGAVDHECRPYELGWLLHAWLAAPGADG